MMVTNKDKTGIEHFYRIGLSTYLGIDDIVISVLN